MPLRPRVKGLKEGPLKAPLGLYRGFMRLDKGVYKAYIGH